MPDWRPERLVPDWRPERVRLGPKPVAGRGHEPQAQRPAQLEAGAMSQPRQLGLRAALVIALACSLTGPIASTLGLAGDCSAYGVVVAALVVRPDFGRWPVVLYPALLVVMGLGMGIGLSVRHALPGAPDVLLFGLVTVVLQLLSLLLPGKLKALSTVLTVAGVLPLLGPGASWSGVGQNLLAIALGLAIGTATQVALSPAAPGLGASPADGPAPGAATEAHPAAPKAGEGAEPSLRQRLAAGLASTAFWRKLVLAVLALAIGEGLGAVTPKYLYFGAVLLLNDSIGATLMRVRDRIIGVSLGVLMPLLVFNSFGLSPLAVALVMGGTAALVIALRLDTYLRTALISSGVSFVGYGPLVGWYIPHRWSDYLLGCVLVLLVGLLVAPDSALRRYRQLLEQPEAGDRYQQLQSHYPEAREEAHWLAQTLAPPEPPTLLAPQPPARPPAPP